MSGEDADYIGGPVFDPALVHGVGQLSDSALAGLVAERVHVRHRVVFDATRRAWLRLASSGEVWTIESGPAIDYAKALVDMCGQCAPRGSEDTATAPASMIEKARAAAYKRLRSAAGVSAIAGLLVAKGSQEHSPIHTTHDEIEATSADPATLWAGGSLWDLRSAARVLLNPLAKSHDVPHLTTAAVAPEFGETPLWDALLGAALPDEEQRAFFLALVGSAVTGHSHRLLGILHGVPGTGKTSLLRAVSSVLGGYAFEAPSSLLDPKGDHQFEAALLGRRLAWVDEGPREGRYATEWLKALTGGARRTTRELFRQPVTWTPEYTLFLTSNDPPQVGDAGLRARVRSVHTTGDTDEVAEAVGQIGSFETSAAWAAERPAVLAALMYEAGQYLRDPSRANNPPAAELELEGLAREQDPVRFWLDERTTAGVAQSSALYADFRDFAQRMGWRNPPTVTAWGRRLNELGYPAGRATTGNQRTRPLGLRSLAVGYLSGLGRPNPTDNPTETRQNPTEPDSETGCLGGPRPPSGPASVGLGPESVGFLSGWRPNPTDATPLVPPVFRPDLSGSVGFAQGVVARGQEGKK